jgi:hypothetical protein
MKEYGIRAGIQTEKGRTISGRSLEDRNLQGRTILGRTMEERILQGRKIDGGWDSGRAVLGRMIYGEESGRGDLILVISIGREIRHFLWDP